MAKLKESEEKNRRLKKMYAGERIKAEIVAEALQKSGSAISTARVALRTAIEQLGVPKIVNH